MNVGSRENSLYPPQQGDVVEVLDEELKVKVVAYCSYHTTFIPHQELVFKTGCLFI